MRRALKRAVPVAVVYLAVVCGLTWPLAKHLASHLPAISPSSTYDPLYSGWALAWESHTLARGSFDIANANIYFPAPDSLFYGPAALGALPYFAPTYLFTGNPTLALNVLLLVAFALTATTIHLVTHAWTASHSASVVAAASFLSNRWLLLTFVPTTPHLSVLLYFPLIIFMSANALTPRAAALLVVLIVLQCMTDVSYVAPAVLAPLMTIGGLRLLRQSTRAAGLQLLLITLAAVVVTVAVHAPYLSVAANNPNLANQTNWRIDPTSSVLNLPLGLMGPLSPLSMPSLAFVLPAAVGVLSLRGWRGSAGEASAIRHVLVWAAVGIIISLPMHVVILGYDCTLPHLLLLYRWMPIASVLRVPDRVRVTALIAIALLVGLTFAELLRHLGLPGGRDLRRRGLHSGIAALIALAMYMQYATTVGQPEAYGQRLSTRYELRRPPGDSPVLQMLRATGGPTIEVPLPARWPVNPKAHAPAMYRSIFHWQQLLNGYGSYWPAGFPQRMRLATGLPDPRAVRALRRQTGLQFILVRLRARLPIDDSLAQERAAWLDLVKSGGRPDLRLLASDDSLALFQVTDEPARSKMVVKPEANTNDSPSPQ